MPSLSFDPEETIHWEQTHPRTVSPEDWTRFEGYAAERNQLLKFINDNHIENVVFVAAEAHTIE